jgi:PAS domain S-box-containing protein
MTGQPKKTILLVEDEALIAMNEAAALKKRGFEVVTAYNAKQAVAKALNNNIDLVLMDIDLGKGKPDGTEAAESILQTKDVPIVFLSSHTEPEVVEKTENITSYGYVVKGSGDTVLLTSIKMAFRLHESRMYLKREKNANELRAKLLDAVEQAVIATGLNGTITYWNRYAENLYGWKEEETLGKNIGEITVPEVSQVQAEQIMANLSEGEPWAGEFLVQDKGGRRFFAHVTNSPVLDEQGRLIGIIGLSYDISKQRETEKERDRLIWELQERVKELNCLYGLSKLVESAVTLEKIFEGLSDLVPPSWQYPETACARITYENTTYTSGRFEESRWIQSAAIVVYGETRGAVEVFYAEEKPKAYEGPFLKEERALLNHLAERLGRIIERFEAEQIVEEQRAVIKKSEELHRITLTSIGDAVISTDTKGRVIRMNEVAQALTGYSEEEARHRPIQEVFTIVHSKTGDIIENPVEKVLSTGEIIALSNHTKLISSKGNRFQVADTAAPIRDDSGNIHGVVLVFRDETKKYEQQEKLRQSEETFRRLFESMAQGVVYHNRKGEIIRANSAAEGILGLTYDQMIGRTSMDPRWRTVREDGSEFPGESHPVMVALRTGRKVEREVMGVFHPDKDTYVWISVSAVPEFLPGESKPYRVFATFEDITDKTKLLNEKDMLLRETHHRVKNNMNIIASLLSLQADGVKSAAAEKALLDARNRIVSMQKLYDHLFRSESYVNINLGTYLEDLLQEIAQTYATDRLTIYSKLEDLSISVKTAVPVGILINEIVANAVKYAFPGERKGVIGITMNRYEKGRVILLIQDDGVGLPEGIESDDTGYGFGLIYTLVEQIDGEIEIIRDNGTLYKIAFSPTPTDNTAV